MSKWQVILKTPDDEITIKEYPYKLQAVIYCFTHGYVNRCIHGCWLREDIKINEVKNE